MTIMNGLDLNATMNNHRISTFTSLRIGFVLILQVPKKSPNLLYELYLGSKKVSCFMLWVKISAFFSL